MGRWATIPYGPPGRRWRPPHCGKDAPIDCASVPEKSGVRGVTTTEPNPHRRFRRSHQPSSISKYHVPSTARISQHTLEDLSQYAPSDAVIIAISFIFSFCSTAFEPLTSPCALAPLFYLAFISGPTCPWPLAPVGLCIFSAPPLVIVLRTGRGRVFYPGTPGIHLRYTRTQAGSPSSLHL